MPACSTSDATAGLSGPESPTSDDEAVRKEITCIYTCTVFYESIIIRRWVFSFCSIQFYILDMGFPFLFCILIQFGCFVAGEHSREDESNLSAWEKICSGKWYVWYQFISGQSQNDHDLKKQTFRVDSLPWVVNTDCLGHLPELEGTAGKIRSTFEVDALQSCNRNYHIIDMNRTKNYFL